MLKEELEKMFDYNFGHDNEDLPIIKKFIFETIIPEVLKSILEINWERSNDFTKSKISWNYILKDIKQKAKENFWIDL